MPDRRRLLLLAAPALAAVIAAAGPGPSTAGPQVPPPASASSLPEVAREAPREIRALWVARTSLVSPTDVAAIVRDAGRHGFNTLLVQVRGRGDAFFNGGIEPRAEQLAGQSEAFDPLGELITAAHAAGLWVHAWVNVNLAASAARLPAAETHVVHAHPEWLMVPRALAQELADRDPRRPDYVRRLAAWTRANGNSVEGLFVSPIHEAAAAHTRAVVADLVDRYPVDGIHLDYVRFPNSQFDYSRAALEAFRADIAPRLDGEARARLEARRAARVTAYAEAFPEQWAAFRRGRLTALVEQLAQAVRSRRPQALLTAAVMPDPADATNARLQDWPAWLQEGLIDVVCPMIYTSSTDRFAAQLDLIRAAAAGRPVWAGIGAWRLTPAETVRRITLARDRGFGGVVLFSYDSLARDRAGFLATVDRDAFRAGAEVTSSR